MVCHHLECLRRTRGHSGGLKEHACVSAQRTDSGAGVYIFLREEEPWKRPRKTEM